MTSAIALCAAIAALSFGLAWMPGSHTPIRLTSWFRRSRDHYASQLTAARLHFDPHRFTVTCWVTPPLLALTGIVIGSPVVAAVAGVSGLLLPRFYLDWLLRQQRRRTEAEAPRLLQVMLASFAAGSTYLEMLEEARRRATDRWLREDLDEIVSNFHLDVPLEDTIAKVRRRSAGRNLGLIWDNLAICIANRIPAAKAKGLFAELANTVQFNVQVQQEIRARTSGQRVQIWLLAAIVPGLFLYLRFLNPDFFSVLDSTDIGRYFLFPAAIFLEVAGVVLSFRVAEVQL